MNLSNRISYICLLVFDHIFCKPNHRKNGELYGLVSTGNSAKNIKFI